MLTLCPANRFDVLCGSGSHENTLRGSPVPLALQGDGAQIHGEVNATDVGLVLLNLALVV